MPQSVPNSLHGDETGLVKVTKYAEDAAGKTEQVFGTQSREFGVDRFCSFGESNVAVALKNASLKMWDGVEFTQVASSLNNGSRIRSLLSTAGGSRVVSLAEDGSVQVRKWPDAGEVSLDTTKLVKCLDGAGINGTSVAFGGKDVDLKIWDLETQQYTFQARNVPNNFLDLAVPIWITDVGFARTSGSSVLFTSTAFNQIRAYDQRQRKPIKDISMVKFKDDGFNHHLNCLRVTPEDQVVVADIHGDVTLVDVLNTGRMVARYKGSKGSVRALDINEDTRTLACGGMDRVVRLYNLDSRQVVGRCYVKQKITALTVNCFAPIKKSANEDDDEDDEVWSEESENELEEEDGDDDEEEEKSRAKKAKH
ncbi:hypothetical protein BASA81_016557 [Batrachochytrium salamandrivorans]|nr:hypothetical protein BASA81_016557 [Batrachochytrium salamandrivorans]